MSGIRLDTSIGLGTMIHLVVMVGVIVAIYLKAMHRLDRIEKKEDKMLKKINGEED